jgi:hypothetical protein
VRDWDTQLEPRAWQLGGRADWRTVALVAALLALVLTPIAVAEVLAARAAGAAIAGSAATPQAATPRVSAPAAGLQVPAMAQLAGQAPISATPQRGAIFACVTRFPGGGVPSAGPWLAEDGSVSLGEKPVVDGSVTWPARFSVTREANVRDLTSNGLPDHPTGVFPISPADDAHAYDRNPNAIREVPLTLSIPALPEPAAQPACLPMGRIGVLRTGAAVFNALDAQGRDAVAYEMQDACAGHPGPVGAYHYHALTPCLLDAAAGSLSAAGMGEHSVLMGYALDGFGIYGSRGEGGVPLTTGDLDDCHGHTHLVEWDGQLRELYHYHATRTYPYTLGCFRGTPAANR